MGIYQLLNLIKHTTLKSPPWSAIAEVPNLQAKDWWFLSDQQQHQITDKVNNKCNALESSPNHPLHSWSLEKWSSMKFISGAKKVGDCCARILVKTLTLWWSGRGSYPIPAFNKHLDVGQITYWGFPGGSVLENLPANAEDAGLVSG